MTLEFTGEANDYVSKGLSGGRIVVRPPKAFRSVPAEQPDDGTRHRHTTDEVLLKTLIEQHLAATDSEVARAILADWANYRDRFVKVFPHEYRRALKEIAAGQLKEAA